MNDEQIISSDVELSHAESTEDDVLTVEMPSEIRAGAARVQVLQSTHTDYPGCKCFLA